MGNDILAKRMRTENAEQFFTLVRMHLSFVLDLNGEDQEISTEKKGRQLKWNLPFSKRAKGISKPADCFQLNPNLAVQMNIIIEYLKTPDCLSQEGIFRRTGKLKRQQDLKAKLSANEVVDFDSGEYSVHDCASVLKTYLSELPEPLLTESHYPAYCQVAQLTGNKERLMLALQLLILLLPIENYHFLEDVLKLLNLVAQHASTNRMSSANLATLFTPHLLWPRRLAPESLQANLQILSPVVEFMVEHAEQMFLVPDTLATDIRAYWEKKERRRRSPMRVLNESVCDGTTASTVFTFVDREKTAQENGSNPTELALAQLYAHIQALPDSARKRRLVKNFNKKNGQGTPAIRNGERNKHRRSRSLRDSIKKHLSGFGKNGKTPDSTSPCSSDSTSPEPIMKTPLMPISATKTRRLHLKPEKETKTTKENCDPLENTSRSKSCDVLNSPSLDNVLTKPQKRPSPNQICDVKPAKLLSSGSSLRGKNIRVHSTSGSGETAGSLIGPTKKSTAGLIKPITKTSPITGAKLARTLRSTSPPDMKKSDSLCTPKTQPKNSPLRSSFKRSCHQKFSYDDALKRPMKHLEQTFNTPLSVSNVRIHEYGLPCITNHLSSATTTTPQRPRYPCSLTTSTPANRNACLLTPHVERNTSMSPITRSAQRMPRAMQETMMTPRSRKPVVSLSGSDLCHLTSLEPWTPVDAEKRLILEESENSVKDSLSSTFRDYLISRSVLTDSPADLSFSSRTDDFQSLSGKTSSLEELRSLANKSMSDSFLFCMDGNDPVDAAPPKNTTSRSTHVCETAI